MVMLRIKLKEMTHAATLSDPPGWMKGVGQRQNSTFLEYGNVAYQIEWYQIIWNRECSNIQAHILSLHIPSTPGVRSKVKTFFSF